MNNPWNPSPDEIRDWAHTLGAVEPCQDWQLALTWSLQEKALLETASDESCPNRRYMLGIIYFVVGHAIQDNFRSRTQPIIEGFIARGREYNHPDIRIWQRRSMELLANPASFEYESWCCLGLANGDLQ